MAGPSLAAGATPPALRPTPLVPLGQVGLNEVAPAWLPVLPLALQPAATRLAAVAVATRSSATR